MLCSTMRCAFFIALALCLAVGGARRAQMETGAQATESSLSSLYSLRRGHTHKKHSHLLSKQLPRFAEDGSVVAASVLNASWSADHRVIDGATMAYFGNDWKAYVEEPERMLAELR